LNTAAIRVVLLATLLFGLNAWSIRHLGSGFQEFAIVNTFLGFLAIALGWIDSGEAGNLRERVKSVLRRATEFQILLPLYLITIVGTSLVSSITVLSDGVNGSTTLFVTAEGETRCADCEGKSLSGPSGSVRFIRFTSVFGRSVYLEGTGYQRKSLTLFPWTGSTISLASDVVRQPSITLRIPPTLQPMLANGRMTIEIDGQEVGTEISTRADRGSVQIGPAAAIPETWRNEWRSQLRAIGSLPDSLREAFFRNWIDPIRDESLPPILPGQLVTVRYYTSDDNNEVIRHSFIVGTEALQDIALIPRSQP
jgi:hypothetical protein